MKRISLECKVWMSAFNGLHRTYSLNTVSKSAELETNHTFPTCPEVEQRVALCAYQELGHSLPCLVHPGVQLSSYFRTSATII